MAKSFKTWIIQFREEDSPRGDLARDIKWDKAFPTTTNGQEMHDYLVGKAGIEGLRTFKEVFAEYEYDVQPDFCAWYLFFDVTTPTQRVRMQRILPCKSTLLPESGEWFDMGLEELEWLDVKPRGKKDYEFLLEDYECSDEDLEWTINDLTSISECSVLEPVFSHQSEHHAKKVLKAEEEFILRFCRDQFGKLYCFNESTYPISLEDAQKACGLVKEYVETIDREEISVIEKQWHDDNH